MPQVNGEKVITAVVRLVLLVLAYHLVAGWFATAELAPEKAYSLGYIMEKAFTLSGVIWLIAITRRIVECDV